MKPPAFDYFVPQSLEEALELLSEHGDGAKILAGGQSLIPMLNFRLLAPRCLIDINRIEALPGISRDKNELTVGAMTRTRVARDIRTKLRRHALLSMTLYRTLRIFRFATGVRSAAHCRTPTPPPSFRPRSSRLRELWSSKANAANDQSQPSNFFKGYLTTCLEADELVTQIRLPAQPAGSGYAFLEVSRRHGDFALAGVAATLSVDSHNRCTEASIVLTGVHDTPFRASGAIAVLRGAVINSKRIAEAAHLATDGLTPQSDIHASAEYRINAARVLTARALTKAYGRARAKSIGSRSMKRQVRFVINGKSVKARSSRGNC